MSWNPLEAPQDFIVLSGQRSPGIATIEGAGSKRNWDKRKGYALSGAICVFKGLDLSEFKVRLKLVSVQDWNDWDAWKTIVQRPPPVSFDRGVVPTQAEATAAVRRARPHAMDIEHPMLESLEIRSVVVTNVSQAEQVEDGVWVITIDFLEFRQPTRALAIPSGSSTHTLDPEELRNQQIGIEIVGVDAQTDLARATNEALR